MMDRERYYRIRFYIFLVCGAIVSIFYILTLGVSFYISEQMMRGEIASANLWHQKEYEKAWTYRRVILDHIANHDRAIVREEEYARENREILLRIEGILLSRPKP